MSSDTDTFTSDDITIKGWRRDWYVRVNGRVVFIGSIYECCRYRAMLLDYT